MSSTGASPLASFRSARTRKRITKTREDESPKEETAWAFVLSSFRDCSISMPKCRFY